MAQKEAQRLFAHEHIPLLGAQHNLQHEQVGLGTVMDNVCQQLTPVARQVKVLRRECEALRGWAETVMRGVACELLQQVKAIYLAAVADKTVQASAQGQTREVAAELARVQEQWLLFRHTKQQDIDHLSQDIQVSPTVGFGQCRASVSTCDVNRCIVLFKVPNSYIEETPTAHLLLCPH